MSEYTARKQMHLDTLRFGMVRIVFKVEEFNRTARKAEPCTQDYKTNATNSAYNGTSTNSIVLPIDHMARLRALAT